MANTATVNCYDWNSDTSEMASRGATYAGEPGAIYLSNHSYSYITGWNYTGNPSRLWEWWGNGTNAAKNTTAILQTTGDYQISVSIADTGGLAVTSAVNVRVLQTEDSLVVTPASANVQFGTTRLFSASLLDQFGAPMGSQPASFEWTGGGGDTIDDPNYEGSASGSLVIEPGNDLVSWKNEHFTPAEQTAGLAANNADPDFDTLPNLAEYALGTDPRQFTPHLIPTLDANGLTLTFTRPANLPDVTYAAESSEELETWSPIPLEVITPGDPETVRARDPLTTGDPSKRFLRLRFEIP